MSSFSGNLVASWPPTSSILEGKNVFMQKIRTLDLRIKLILDKVVLHDKGSWKYRTQEKNRYGELNWKFPVEKRRFKNIKEPFLFLEII